MTLGGNRDGARRVLAEVVGLTAWGAALGYGSFVTIEFGKEVADRSWRPGEWHLWVYGAAWKLLAGEHEIADSDGDRVHLAVVVPQINGLTVRSVVVDNDLTVCFDFAGSHRLVIARGPDPELEDWRLNTPDGLVHIFGPGDRQRSLRSNEPDYGQG